jgi:hypothetical protein
MAQAFFDPSHISRAKGLSHEGSPRCNSIKAGMGDIHHGLADSPSRLRKAAIHISREGYVRRPQSTRSGCRERHHEAASRSLSVAVIVVARRHDHDAPAFGHFRVDPRHVEVAHEDLAPLGTKVIATDLFF